jgi:hypothetical protein
LSKYDVVTPFKDKNSKESYGVGDQYETKDEDRVKFLQQEGYLGEMAEASGSEASAPEPDEPESKEEPEPTGKSKKKKKSSKESQGSDE